MLLVVKRVSFKDFVALGATSKGPSSSIDSSVTLELTVIFVTFARPELLRIIVLDLFSSCCKDPKSTFDGEAEKADWKLN
jgi:hypothetical protein